MPKRLRPTSCDATQNRNDVVLRYRSDALEAREEAEINFARLLTESGYDDTAYTSMDAARIFLRAVMDEHVCPYVAAKYLFGLDREQLDQLMESGDTVARKIRQVEGAQEFERLRSVGRVKRRAFDAAMGDSHPDRKLILQAYEPDTFVPVTKSKVTVNDIEDAFRGASDDEVRRHSGLEDTGTG